MHTHAHAYTQSFMHVCRNTTIFSGKETDSSLPNKPVCIDAFDIAGCDPILAMTLAAQ